MHAHAYIQEQKTMMMRAVLVIHLFQPHCIFESHPRHHHHHHHKFQLFKMVKFIVFMLSTYKRSHTHTFAADSSFLYAYTCLQLEIKSDNVFVLLFK